MVGIVGDATQGDANAPNGTSRIIDLLVSASMPPALRCCHSNTARAHTHIQRRERSAGDWSSQPDQGGEKELCNNEEICSYLD